MATTYINGTNKGNSTGSSIYGVNKKLPLGRIDNSAGASPNTIILGQDVPLGRIDQGSSDPLFRDRAPNVPSGYNANGTPTYGQGKKNTVVTLAEDRSGGSKLTKFVYSRPQKPTSTLFTSLT